MAQPQFSAGRGAFIIAIAVVAAFLLLQLWAWSAQYPWSNDAWLMAIPVVIIVGGLLAATTLAIILRKREK